MEAKNKAYAYLVLSILLVGVFGSLITLKIIGIIITPFILYSLPFFIIFSIKKMIKNFKKMFR